MDFQYTDGAFVTPLIKAVVTNNVEGVKEALGQGFSANLPDNRGWTPLHEAAIRDTSIDSLKLLLEHSSAFVNAQTFERNTPLILACKYGCIKAVKQLLKHPGCNVNLANDEGVHPIHMACGQGNLDIVKLLVRFGANVNAQDGNGYTPLHETVTHGPGLQNRDENSKQICKFLLEYNANPDILEDQGNSPLHLACQNGLLKSLEFLLASSIHPDLVMVNSCNKDGRTPLMLAVQSCNIQIVQVLLSKGANSNIIDNFNAIALHLAAHTGNFELFNLLYTVTFNETILNYCTVNEERIFEEIINGKTSFSLICLAIDTEDLTFLTNVLQSNLDPSVLQCPALHSVDILNKIITLHTPVSFLLESKMSDLGDSTVDFLSVLINHGIPLKVKSKISDVSYIDPLCASLVALNDCPVNLVIKCLRMLLEHGADPDDSHGKMPHAMEQACMRGCVEAVLLLLQFSNLLEPEDVIRWIEQETSTNQERIIEALLPLSPYYTPTSALRLLMDSTRRKDLLTPKVYSLAMYCRTVVRKQLREESKSSSLTFREILFNLPLPKDVCQFLSFM